MSLFTHSFHDLFPQPFHDHQSTDRHSIAHTLTLHVSKTPKPSPPLHSIHHSIPNRLHRSKLAIISLSVPPNILQLLSTLNMILFLKDEAVEEKMSALFPAGLAGLDNSNWKERLSACEKLLEVSSSTNCKM